MSKSTEDLNSKHMQEFNKKMQALTDNLNSSFQTVKKFMPIFLYPKANADFLAKNFEKKLGSNWTSLVQAGFNPLFSYLANASYLKSDYGSAFIEKIPLEVAKPLADKMQEIFDTFNSYLTQLQKRDLKGGYELAALHAADPLNELSNKITQISDLLIGKARSIFGDDYRLNGQADYDRLKANNPKAQQKSAGDKPKI